jgi:peptide/nickel transport system permease protein
VADVNRPISLAKSHNVDARKPRKRLARVKRQLYYRLAVVVLIVAWIMAAPLVTQFDPTQQNLMMRLQPAGVKMPDGRVALLGTDQLGRDVYTRILYGGQISLLISVSGVLFAAVVGVGLGLIAGFYGGAIDAIISRITDISLGFPGLLLAITLAAALGPGLLNVIIALGIARWTTYTRVVRSAVFTIKNEEYIQAARALGSSNARIILTHILPNTISPIIIIAALHLGQMILAEASLSFIGLGVQPPTPSWGAMINKAREYITSASWQIAYPGLAVTITVLALGMLGDAVRDVLDPQMKNQGE